MSNTLKKIIALTFSIMLFVFAAVPCFATYEQQGRITVSLCDKDKKDISGMHVHICQIARLDDEGYSPTKYFEGSGVSISGIVYNPSYQAAQSLMDYVKKNGVPGISTVSENGIAEFSNLELGIWLVYPDDDNQYIFNPYIVFLPFQSQGFLHYEISSSPKVEENKTNKINIHVVKKWDDRNNAAKKRPESITIEILNGESVEDSVVLSNKNAWSHTFTDLPRDGKYSVREKAVANYKPTYSGDVNNGFIITNTYTGGKLPQAGQYWWPIIIIAVAGAGFVLLGIIELGAKKNGKKR